ncbi:MAG: dTDP-4-dehydrorhamnose 3,5-epimerase family protein, partial [Flavisolibacter sp.]
MPFETTEIPGLVIFEPKVFEDNRGFFFESYNEQTF